MSNATCHSHQCCPTGAGSDGEREYDRVPLQDLPRFWLSQPNSRCAIRFGQDAFARDTGRVRGDASPRGDHPLAIHAAESRARLCGKFQKDEEARANMHHPRMFIICLSPVRRCVNAVLGLVFGRRHVGWMRSCNVTCMC